MGRKTAARIILELRGKLTDAGTGSLGIGVPADPATSEVVEALQALGYTTAEAVQAVQALGEDTQGLTPQQRVVAAVRQLGQHR